VSEDYGRILERKGPVNLRSNHLNKIIKGSLSIPADAGYPFQIGRFGMRAYSYMDSEVGL